MNKTLKTGITVHDIITNLCYRGDLTYDGNLKLTGVGGDGFISELYDLECDMKSINLRGNYTDYEIIHVYSVTEEIQEFMNKWNPEYRSRFGVLGFYS